MLAIPSYRVVTFTGEDKNIKNYHASPNAVSTEGVTARSGNACCRKRKSPEKRMREILEYIVRAEQNDKLEDARK